MMRRIMFLMWSLGTTFVVTACADSSVVSWAPVKDTSLIIQEGSALDFGRFLLPGPAGRYGRLVAGEGGRLKFEQLDGPARLQCAALAWSPVSGGFPDKDAADLYARQLRLHGYNLVRFHYVDALLMSGKGRDADFDFDAAQLDRWLYFMAALKREGIYWLVDAMTSTNGAMGDVYPHRWIAKYDLKRRVYYDPIAQQHWRELARRLLAMENPYTKLRVIDDPALAGIVLVNENDLAFMALVIGSWPAGLQPAFNKWLSERYKATPRAAWIDGEELLAGKVALPEKLNERSLRMEDFQRFLVDTEVETATWMTSYLRQLGYRGLVTSYDASYARETDIARSTLDWIDMHTYHDHSSSYDPGAQINQNSSLDGAAKYARTVAVSRQVGRPFSLTEYGQPFWNRYLYEAGLVMTTLARLQDWDFACLHAEGAIDMSFQEPFPRKIAMHPYGVGIDPVARAGETLAALLNLRGDVMPASHSIRLDISGEKAWQAGSLGKTGTDLSMLAWLTRIQIDAGLKPRPAAGEVAVLPVAGDISLLGKIGMGGGAQLQEAIALLRKKDILGKDNKTDIASGVTQSETGQVMLDSRQAMMRLVTPRTEAVAYRRLQGTLGLGAVSISKASDEALIAASALDGRSLANSQRILLILATDAENTGMKFSDATRRKLVNLGKLPARLRSGTADISLNMAVDGTYRLFSLHLNGDIGDELPLKRKGRELRFTLDNMAPSHGPTTFFLLESE